MDEKQSSDQNTPPSAPLKTGGLIPLDQALPPNLFVLPVNGPVTYPTLLSPLLVSHPKHIAMVEEAINRQRMIGLILTRETREAEAREDTRPEDLYDVGVAVKIVKRLKMPDGSINMLVHSLKRFRMKRVLSERPYIVAETEYLDDIAEKSNEMDALARTVISHVKKLAEVNPFFTEEMRLAMINAPGPGTVADLVAFALTLPKPEAQDFLETLSAKARFEKLLVHLRREQDVANIQKKINDDVNSKINTLQREFFLKEQLKTIKRELGHEEDGKEKSARTFRERIESAGMSDEIKKAALEELAKFETLSESSPEFNISRGYLEMLCALPWSKETRDDLDLEHAKEVLDAEHYGLEKVKERIVEFLAVRNLKARAVPSSRDKAAPAGESSKGSIICLVGPPGVGKTSVGKSIAKTLGRNFFRFSLGGMRDEAEIKGHRRTYVGAMPGKILGAMKRAGTKNCVLMLDEVDKLSSSYQGDPAAALLEVLDPEQNASFVDHYLDLPFDLSKVLFILTANTTATIPAPLLDRMEVIEISGYTLEEKEDIALRYVIPRELEANGVKPQWLRIERPALRKIMTDYAREPGLRSLQQLVGRLARKAATQFVRAKNGSRRPIVIGEDSLVEWLGPKKFYNEIAERATTPGVVVGLAWTAMGGDILFIEAADVPGSGNLKLTGQMGEVMTESAAIAWSYVKKKSSGIAGGPDRKYFREHDIHLHIPAGAIPKDGPSAGVTMATALFSLLSGRKVKNRLAMTGELSLVGKVLPVGGIKEKLLAARRSGVTTVILPKLNEKDLLEVPEYALKGMTLHFVGHVEEVFELALEKSGAARGKTLAQKVLRTSTKTAKRATSRPAPGKRAARKGATVRSPRSY
jgi:ATP-dependent Lon protease